MKRPKRAPAAGNLMRDPRSGVEIAPRGGDSGPQERWQHDSGERVDIVAGGELRRVVRVTSQTPLDRYHTRREITATQWRAGDRLRRDFYFGHRPQRLTAAYAEPGGGGADDWSERRLQARADYLAAMAAVGTVLAAVLMHVVCLDGRASDWATAQGRQGRRAEIAGMTALQLGLDALALWYRQAGRAN